MNYKLLLLWLVSVVTVSAIGRYRHKEMINQMAHEALVAIAQHKPETDPIFTTYQDTLSLYFGNLEQDLIKQYKHNFDNLQTARDFDYFFSNAVTLRATLNKTAQRHAETFASQGRQMHHADWFEKMLPGMQLKVLNNGKNWAIFFDYDLLRQRAGQTDGSADEAFFELMQLCYDKQTQFPAWMARTPDQKLCSQLGKGTHLAILKQIDRAIASGNVFGNELKKIKQMVMSDLLFTKNYCNPSLKALEEIKIISREITFPEKESEMIEQRIVALEAF